MKFFILLITSFLTLMALEIEKVKIATDTNINIPKLQDKVLSQYSYNRKNKNRFLFYIAKYETSVKEYMEYLSASKQIKKFQSMQELDIEDEPVTNIDFQEANQVCHYFKGRLPTELEWIVAAGIKTSPSECYEQLSHNVFYPYSTAEYPIKDSKIVRCMLNKDEEFEADLVGSELSDVEDSTENINGTYGMLGNVWEWVDSSRTYFNQEYKVIKGGSYANFQTPKFYDNRISNFIKSNTKAQNIGFRCLWDIKPKPFNPTKSTTR